MANQPPTGFPAVSSLSNMAANTRGIPSSSGAVLNQPPPAQPYQPPPMGQPYAPPPMAQQAPQMQGPQYGGAPQNPWASHPMPAPPALSSYQRPAMPTLQGGVQRAPVGNRPLAPSMAMDTPAYQAAQTNKFDNALTRFSTANGALPSGTPQPAAPYDPAAAASAAATLQAQSQARYEAQQAAAAAAARPMAPSAAGGGGSMPTLSDRRTKNVISLRKILGG